MLISFNYAGLPLVPVLLYPQVLKDGEDTQVDALFAITEYAINSHTKGVMVVTVYSSLEAAKGNLSGLNP